MTIGWYEWRYVGMNGDSLLWSVIGWYEWIYVGMNVEVLLWMTRVWYEWRLLVMNGNNFGMNGDSLVRLAAVW